MRGCFWITLELGHDSSLELELEYLATHGEAMVRYYPDGSGYPGSPPDAELLSISVGRWDVGDDTRKRDDAWIWSELDRIATEIILDDWGKYGEECLADAAERQEGGH